MSSKSSYIYDNKRLFWVTRTPNTSNALLPSLHSQHIKFVALVVWESITTKMTDDNSTTLSETIKLILLDDHSVTSVLSSPSLLEQMMKVWKKKEEKKASSPTSLMINTWIVFHSLYIESSFLHFSLSQLRSISSTFLSPSHFSADAFTANFSLFLSVAL